jgi:hypothetical protein
MVGGLRPYRGGGAAEFGACTFQQTHGNGVARIEATAALLAGMVTNVRQNPGKGRRAGQQRESFLEVSSGNRDSQGTSVDVKRTGCRARGSLLFNALPLPSPDLVPIHVAIPGPSCVERCEVVPLPPESPVARMGECDWFKGAEVEILGPGSWLAGT